MRVIGIDPGLRRTGEGGPLSTLTRLWPLQAAVGVEEADRALPGLVDPLCAAGVLEQSVSTVRARLDIRPYADDDRDWWVLSDLTPGLDGAGNKVGADHVLGVSAASTSLAQLTVRENAGRALDLGTGCGVQALHLTTHVEQVVATDVNERALDIARINAELNERRKYVESILGNIAAGVVSFDKDGRVTTVNRAAEAMLGLRFVQARGKHWSQAFARADLEGRGEAAAGWPRAASR